MRGFMFKCCHLWLALTLMFGGLVRAQTPQVRLQFDGNLSDISGTGIITSVTPSAGFTPTYGTDRNGTANGAIIFTGAQSLTLSASSIAGDSNQALGLRNAAGTNTSFTMCAWVMFTSLGSGQGYSTIFGNAGSGAGTLHVGLNNNSANTHFGFDANDVNGGSTALVVNVWYHLAFVYDTTASTGQRVYVNGIPDVTRTGVTNTIKAADLMIGNWGTPTDAANDMKGRLDDVVIYNTALKGDQILALANGVSPMSVPAVNTYFPPATTYGYRGTTGMWGIREIKAYPGISYSSIANADRILKAYATTPGGTKVDYWAPVINFSDDEGPGNLGYFDNEGDFATNTPAADDNVLLFARCSIKIPTAGNYTFGFRGDDGSRLRVVGQRFTSSTGGGNANPGNISDMILYPNTTGDSFTLGVVNLAAGEYDLEFTYWEGGSGSSVEVFAAPGSKTSVDSTFQLIGNVAAGGLEIVRDADTVPSFTANGGPSVFVQSGSPSTFTLAWSVNEPTTVLSINQGIGAVAQSGSLVVNSPAVTTTYTITATTGTDVVTKSVTVYVNSAPVIQVFSANDTTVTPGAAVVLSWDVQGATSLTLTPGNINVLGTTTRTVNPTTTTTYTLTASNIAGGTIASVIVTVGAAPTISSFTHGGVPIYGEQTSLNWTIANADTASINQSIGAVSNTGGTLCIVPLLTTTYTLTATNLYGSSTANVTVTMPTPVGVSSTGFTVRRVSSTVAFPFTGQTYLQSALSLLGGQNAGTTTTATGVTTINYSDGADGEFTSGNAAFPGGTGDNFAVEITGTLVVNAPGEYNFILHSDDGGRVRIDGVDIIVDDANHTPTAASGSVVLTKPTATIQIVYYDATGGASLEFGWIRPNLSWQQIGVATPVTPFNFNGLRISEFCASNSSGIVDENGETSDWIEIWNSSSAAVNVSNCFLTNNAAQPKRWAFPSKTLAANEYLVVFASGKNRVNPASNLHTDFTLSASGGYLALNKDDGAGGYTTLTQFNPYPAQTADQTYGSAGSQAFIGFMETPTPGAANAVSYAGFVEPVVFSQTRGRYTSPFSLTLSTATAGAEIRYTTDGSAPTCSRGTVYTSPIPISATSTIRAAAFKTGWKGTTAGSHTYLFLDDVVTQTSSNTVAKGWPALPVNGQVYRYGMALANVTAAGGDVNALKNALAAAPSVCMNLAPDDFHSAATGIYSNPGRRGRLWEKMASFEYIKADGTSGTQVDMGVRIRGNASRSTSNPKHAFHLYFRGLYGGDLKYPLFGTEGAVSQFDQIDLRCEENNSWANGNSSLNSLMREEFARKSLGDMGQPYSRNAYVHLYINGIYWGVFNWEEKTEADYFANQFGGQDSDYDTAKSAAGSGGYNTEMTDGSFIALKNLFDQCLALKNDATESGRTAKYLQLRGLNPDGMRNLAYPVLLDADNLIDYMLVTFYSGSFDAPMSTFLANASNNWFAVRNHTTNDRGWTWFPHDFEHGMGTGTQSFNRVGPWGDPNATGNNWNQTWTTSQYRTRETFTKFNPQYAHEFLCYSAEYRQRFMDRVQKHLFGTGALTHTAAVARADALAAQVDPIIHAEAARWGSTSLTRNTWLNTGKAGVYTFINNGGTAPGGEVTWSARARNLMIYEQLKGYADNGAKPLASTFTPPTFSGQQGGSVSGPYTFTITNPNGTGTLYYTTNGTDPRAIGGSIAGTALTGGSPISVTLVQNAVTVRARVFNSATSEWSPLMEATYIVGASPGSAANLVISKLHYNPSVTVANAEYLEIMNVSAGTVNLTNCRFTLGITFTFPDAYLLPAGGRCLLVENTAAFNAAFPGLSASIAGQYSGNLSNGGERLTFVANNNSIIRDFTYDDVSPWPEEADGEGPALVLIRPETNPDHSLAANWRASTINGGAPTQADSYSFARWDDDNEVEDEEGDSDDDGDGLPNLLEYTLGKNPHAHDDDGINVSSTDVVSLPYMTFTLTRPMGRDDVQFSVECSATLTGTWTTAVLVSRTANYATGMFTEVWRNPDTSDGAERQFMRAKAVKMP